VAERIWVDGMEIIAEVGVHHEGRVDLACNYIDSLIGIADIVKFQMYDADSLCQKESPVYWRTIAKSQYDIFSKKKTMTFDEWALVRDYAKEQGIKFCITPFSLKYVDWCEKLGVDAIKIASADITYKQLLKAINATGKQVYMSTGGATSGEIWQALDCLLNCHVVPMHCSLIYPSTMSDARLGRFRMLRSIFPTMNWGYSCHVANNWESIVVAMRTLGATTLEKHYTLDKTLPGDDHYHSMDREDLIKLRETLTGIESSMDNDSLLQKEVQNVREARRALVLTKDLPCGTILLEEDLDALRPAHGISPMLYKEFIGKALRVDKKKGEMIQWKDAMPVSEFK